MKKPKMIEARSLVSGRNLEPYIELIMCYDDGSEEKVAQWTPGDAYHHAMNVLECVEAANSDAFVLSFFMEKLSLKLEDCGPILLEFRDWRKRQRPPEVAM